MNNFLCQAVPIPKLLATSHTQFCVITYPNFFISDFFNLIDFGLINLILWRHTAILLVINQKWFYFFSFFSSFDLHQSHYLVGSHATGINILLISFLNAFPCLNLLWQARTLTWIIVSGSASSSLSSLRLTLSRFNVLRGPYRH